MAIPENPDPYFQRYLEWLKNGGGARKPPGEKEIFDDERRREQIREKKRRTAEEEELRRKLEARKRELAKLDERWPPGSWWWVRIRDGSLYEARAWAPNLPAVGVALRHIPEGGQFERGWLLPGMEAWAPINDNEVRVIARVEPPESVRVEQADAMLQEDA